MSTKAQPTLSFWKDKRVLLTGHTGFKGSWLAIWLHRLGANIYGFSLKPHTEPNLFTLAEVGDLCCQSEYGDIRDAEALMDYVQRVKPDVVIHLAAQALVRESYRQPVATFATNVLGTAHLLEAIRRVDSVQCALMVTTDKVYDNQEWDWPYRENDRLGGLDPYSASKSASELVITSFQHSFFSDSSTAIASARAGNVIGGGDWSAERLIPDAIRAWSENTPLLIRQPEAVRPWQHVLEPLRSYLVLCEALANDRSYTGAYNFGPHSHDVASVREVINQASRHFPDAQTTFSSSPATLHEAGRLTLDASKAAAKLGIQPVLSLENNISMTMQWYLRQRAGEAARTLVEADLDTFRSLL